MNYNFKTCLNGKHVRSSWTVAEPGFGVKYTILNGKHVVKIIYLTTEHVCDRSWWKESMFIHVLKCYWPISLVCTVVLALYLIFTYLAFSLCICRSRLNWLHPDDDDGDSHDRNDEIQAMTTTSAPSRLESTERPVDGRPKRSSSRVTADEERLLATLEERGGSRCNCRRSS